MPRIKNLVIFMPMDLLNKQMVFMEFFWDLLKYAFENGYRVTAGDFYRDERCPYGAKNSCHKIRLAVDLNLFKGKKYLAKTEDYKMLGDFWKSLSNSDVKCCWGGDFQQADGNHFSIEHEGRK